MGVFKWLLVPAALGFVGFTFIGPYIGQKPPEGLKSIQDKIVPPEPKVVVGEAEPVASNKEWPEPKVEVELKRLNGTRVQDRERSKQPKVEESVPEVTEDAAPTAPTAEDEQPAERDPSQPVDGGSAADDGPGLPESPGA